MLARIWGSPRAVGNLATSTNNSESARLATANYDPFWFSVLNTYSDASGLIPISSVGEVEWLAWRQEREEARYSRRCPQTCGPVASALDYRRYLPSLVQRNDVLHWVVNLIEGTHAVQLFDWRNSRQQINRVHGDCEFFPRFHEADGKIAGPH
jgi:hypothetical protein